MERAYLRNVLAVPLAFSQGRHWHGRNNVPQIHISVLGFGAKSVPLFALNHFDAVHVTAVDTNEKVTKVQQDFFGVPLPVVAQQFTIMSQHPDRLVDRRCSYDGRLCVRTQGVLDYIKGVPDQSIDLLVVDCVGDGAKTPPWLGSDLPSFVRHVKRSAEVVLINAPYGGSPDDEKRLKSQRQAWLKGGFREVGYYSFDASELKAVQAELCPGEDCGKFNRFLLVTSSRARTQEQAMATARGDDARLGLGSSAKLDEVIKALAEQGH